MTSRLGDLRFTCDRLNPYAVEPVDLVTEGDTEHVHSVLLQPAIDFTIYHPPSRLDGGQPGRR